MSQRVDEYRRRAPDLASTMGVPAQVASTMQQSYTCEWSVSRRDGTPVTYPLTPYPNPSGLSVDVSIGLLFPWKAELARRNPKVCLSYCDPTDYHQRSPAVVVVKGHAAVRDRDLQANTDRYLAELMEALPRMFGNAPKSILRRLAFYLARIWVEVTPIRIHWWPDGDLTRSPELWRAPEDIHLPSSDPPPDGPPSADRSLFSSPPDWRPGLNSAIDEFGPPSLTIMDDHGWPTTIPNVSAESVSKGCLLQPARFPGIELEGPACLTFHEFAIDDGQPYQRNRSFTGQARSTLDGVVFEPDRQLVSASLPNKAQLAKTFYKVWRMRKRLPHEARRRRQPVPKVRV